MTPGSSAGHVTSSIQQRARCTWEGLRPKSLLVLAAWAEWARGWRGVNTDALGWDAGGGRTNMSWSSWVFIMTTIHFIIYLPLGSWGPRWRWTRGQNRSGTWCACVGAAGVCTGSNRRRPESAGAAGINGFRHSRAGGGTGRAPPAGRGPCSQLWQLLAISP